MDLKDSFEALLKVNVEKDEALIALRKEKEKATTKNEGELKKLSGELTKLKETYEKDKLKWCESVDTERWRCKRRKMRWKRFQRRWRRKQGSSKR